MTRANPSSTVVGVDDWYGIYGEPDAMDDGEIESIAAQEAQEEAENPDA